MSLDLTVLAAAVLWGFLQIVLAARAANWQHGLRWAASPRDEPMPPFAPIHGRCARNLRNYLESSRSSRLPFCWGEAAGTHNGWTEWGALAYLGGRLVYTPLYIAGVPLVRSLAWNKPRAALPMRAGSSSVTALPRQAASFDR